MKTKNAKTKQRTLLDTYPSTEAFNDARVHLLDGCCHVDDEEDVTDELVWEYVNDMLNYTIQDFIDELTSMDAKYSNYSTKCAEYILMGTVGTWRGNMRGGKYLSTLPELLSEMGDVDYIKVYAEKGRIYVRGTHHDGTHCMELRMRKDNITDDSWERLDEDSFYRAETYTKSTYFMFKEYFAL